MDVTKTGNGEQAMGNRERRMGSGERESGNECTAVTHLIIPNGRQRKRRCRVTSGKIQLKCFTKESENTSMQFSFQR